MFLPGESAYWSHRGMSNYMKGFLTLLAAETDVEIEIRYIPWQVNRKVGYIARHLFFWCVVPFLVRKDQLVVCGFNIGPMFGPRDRVICVVHDLIELRAKSIVRRSFAGLSAFFYGKYGHLIAPSRCTRLELVTLFGLKGSTVSVIYNFIDRRVQNAVIPLKKRRSARYFDFILFYGAGVSKNCRFAFEVLKQYALRQEGHKLNILIFGSARYTNEMNTSLFNIRWEEKVSNQHKFELMSDAKFLLFPSVEEGFGIPVIEAWVCDVIPLCSDLPITREVLGSAEMLESFFFNPTDLNSVLFSMKRAFELPDEFSLRPYHGAEQAKEQFRVWLQKFEKI